MINSLPICFYPMRKIVLDDDHAFSQSILLKMHGKNFISYNSPEEALDFLLNRYQPILTKADLIAKEAQIADSSTQHIININIQKLKKMLMESQHPDINVLIVDYHMPGMLGTEFLKEIQSFPIKKALITGEKDYKIAIDAFNEGLVDAYLRKDDPNFSTRIQEIVSDLEWTFFSELSNLVYDLPDFDFLKHIPLITVFKKFIKENNVSAFCLSHIQGNFITQNIRGEQHHILVRKKTQLEEIAKIAEDDGATVETIQNLKNGRMIPYFGSKEYWEIPANEWTKFLYPASNFSNDSNLVWTAITL